MKNHIVYVFSIIFIPRNMKHQLQWYTACLSVKKYFRSAKKNLKLTRIIKPTDWYTAFYKFKVSKHSRM